MGSKMLPFEEMWPRVAAKITMLGTEARPLQEAAFRVTRAPLVAAWDLPRFDNSAMDGYAVRSEDCTEPLTRLRLVPGDAYAGSAGGVVVGRGHACPIGTGGMVPSGADAIAQKEIVRREGDAIVVESPLKVGTHIRRQGEELREGEPLVESGALLTPLSIAACANAGIKRAEVGIWPKVAVVSTGSELVALGEDARGGQIVDSNGPLLSLSIQRLTGSVPVTIQQAHDQESELRGALESAFADADVVLLSGGVSVGDRDLVKAMLEDDFGVERLFWRVAQKPGKPLYVGTRGQQWVIGLPGNPATVAVLWPLLVKPLLLALAGLQSPAPPRVSCKLALPTATARGRTQLRWCESWSEDGVLWVRALPRGGSHMLSDLAQASVLAILSPCPEGEMPANSVVPGIRLDQETV